MAQAITPKQVVIYSDQKGNEPFSNWFNGLKDKQVSRRILSRLRRLEQGNFGDSKHLRDGVFELRLFFGSGYRIYYAEDGEQIVLLLTGGDKSSQSKDIEAAVAYWKEFKNA